MLLVQLLAKIDNIPGTFIIIIFTDLVEMLTQNTWSTAESKNGRHV